MRNKGRKKTKIVIRPLTRDSSRQSQFKVLYTHRHLFATDSFRILKTKQKTQHLNNRTLFWTHNFTASHLIINSFSAFILIRIVGLNNNGLLFIIKSPTFRKINKISAADHHQLVGSSLFFSLMTGSHFNSDSGKMPFHFLQKKTPLLPILTRIWNGIVYLAQLPRFVKFET